MKKFLLGFASLFLPFSTFAQIYTPSYPTYFDEVNSTTIKPMSPYTTIQTTNLSVSGTFTFTGVLAGSLNIQNTGTAKANLDIIGVTNLVNAADMDGTETSMVWNQYYYNATTPATADSGRISVGTETDWTSTASTQDSYMAFETAVDGTVTERARITSAGNVGIGTTSPDRLFHVESSTALTNTVSYAQRLSHITSGTPATSIGVGLEFEQETSASNNEVLATIETIATDATGAQEDGAIVFKTMTAGAAATEKFRIDGDGEIRITNGNWLTSVDNAGTGVINMFKVNASDEIEVGGSLTGLESWKFEEDAGAVTFVDMPVSSSAVDGTEESYAFRVDASTVAQIKASSDGAGGVDELQLIVAPTVQNNASFPSLAFGDGDTGFYESADDVLNFTFGASARWEVDVTELGVQTTDAGPILKWVGATSISPGFSFHADQDTGIGRNTADQLSLISGGQEMLRLVETGTATTEQIIISPSEIIGTAATPALAFGDGDTGFYESADDVLNVSIAGVVLGTFSVASAGLDIKNGSTSQGILNLYEDSDDGTNKISISSGGALANDVTVTLGETTEDYVLKYNAVTHVWSGEAIGMGGETLAATLAIGADANDVSITSLAKLEGKDNAIYIDLSNDGYIDIEADAGVRFGTAGVQFLDDGDGAITFTGLGDGNDESLIINLDDTADEIDFTSGTSAVFDFNELIKAGSYALAGIDGDDINSNIAGRSLTLTGAAPDTLDIDAEIYTDTKCIYWENPTDADDFKSIWRNSTAGDYTITEIWAESDQTVTFMLQVDDGTPADVDSVDLAPAAGEAEDTSLNGDTTLAADEELDLAITSTANDPTWCSICWTYQKND